MSGAIIHASFEVLERKLMRIASVVAEVSDILLGLLLVQTLVMCTYMTYFRQHFFKFLIKIPVSWKPMVHSRFQKRHPVTPYNFHDILFLQVSFLHHQHHIYIGL
jgi:hypothetical protein